MVPGVYLLPSTLTSFESEKKHKTDVQPTVSVYYLNVVWCAVKLLLLLMMMMIMINCISKYFLGLSGFFSSSKDFCENFEDYWNSRCYKLDAVCMMPRNTTNCTVVGDDDIVAFMHYSCCHRHVKMKSSQWMNCLSPLLAVRLTQDSFHMLTILCKCSVTYDLTVLSASVSSSL